MHIIIVIWAKSKNFMHFRQEGICFYIQKINGSINHFYTYLTTFPCFSNTLCKSLFVKLNGRFETYTVHLLGANLFIIQFNKKDYVQYA